MAPQNAVTKTRVRTGCLTCRKKKIKCDESRPICKNCEKPGRVCSYSLATRDHHNPTMNSNLKNCSKFFLDRPDYSNEQLDSFIPVPHIEWKPSYTPNNYERQQLLDPENHYAESMASGRAGYPNPNLVRAQQTATHGLEALSAAAADYTHTSQSHNAGAYPGSYVMNAGPGGANAIDPNLDAKRGEGDVGEGRSSHEDAADEQLAHALRLHAQQAEGVRMEREGQREG